MTPLDHTFYDAMQEVLRRPRYDLLTERAVDYRRTLTDAVERALTALLDRIPVGAVSLPDVNLDAVTYIFALVGALLILGSLSAVVWLVMRRRHRKRDDADALSFMEALFEDISGERFRLDEVLRLRREHAERGEFREAVRYGYIAVLVTLHKAKIIRVDKSKTNAQLVNEMSAAAPQDAPAFRDVVIVFQATWFGLKRIDAERYAAHHDHATLLLGGAE